MALVSLVIKLVLLFPCILTCVGIQHNNMIVVVICCKIKSFSFDILYWVLLGIRISDDIYSTLVHNSMGGKDLFLHFCSQLQGYQLSWKKKPHYFETSLLCHGIYTNLHLLLMI